MKTKQSTVMRSLHLVALIALASGGYTYIASADEYQTYLPTCTREMLDQFVGFMIDDVGTLYQQEGSFLYPGARDFLHLLQERGKFFTIVSNNVWRGTYCLLQQFFSPDSIQYVGQVMDETHVTSALQVTADELKRKVSASDLFYIMEKQGACYYPTAGELTFSSFSKVLTDSSDIPLGNIYFYNRPQESKQILQLFLASNDPKMVVAVDSGPLYMGGLIPKHDLQQDGARLSQLMTMSALLRNGVGMTFVDSTRYYATLPGAELNRAVAGPGMYYDYFDEASRDSGFGPLDIIGKSGTPESQKYLFATALQNLNQQRWNANPHSDPIERSQIAIIGDDIYTDMAFGEAANVRGILLLSGNTKPGMAKDWAETAGNFLCQCKNISHLSNIYRNT